MVDKPSTKKSVKESDLPQNDPDFAPKESDRVTADNSPEPTPQPPVSDVDERSVEESGRPTEPAEVSKASAPAKVEKGDELKDGKGVVYFLNRSFSGLSVLVKELALNQIEVERFVPYYDTWKGDQVRIGYLATTNDVVIEKCLNDPTCEEISFSEYKLALQGDGKRHKPLGRAPLANSI